MNTIHTKNKVISFALSAFIIISLVIPAAGLVRADDVATTTDVSIVPATDVSVATDSAPAVEAAQMSAETPASTPTCLIF